MKKIIFHSVATFLIATNIYAQSQGPNSPGSAGYSAIGCLACPGGEWNDYNNIMAADGLYADVGLSEYPMCFQTSCFYSRYLMAYNFGFTIPASAIITGVKAEMLRMTNASNAIRDTIVELYTQGSFGTNHASAVPWTPNPQNIIYGDSIDLWGMTLTPDSVNQSDFGFRVMIRNGSPTVSLSPSSVDHIKMTVYYTLTTGTFSQTRTAGISPAYYSQDDNALVVAAITSRMINNITVTDILGNEIYSFTPAAGQQKFFLPGMVNGIYFAIVSTNEKTIANKFVVNK